MFGLPSHWIYLVKKDGTKENVANTDCSTKNEVRQEVKELFKYWGENCKKEDYATAQYVGRDQKTILYEFNLEELED